MPKWLLITLHVVIGASSVVAGLNIGDTKAGGAIIAAGALANALLRSPVDKPAQSNTQGTQSNTLIK